MIVNNYAYNRIDTGKELADYLPRCVFAYSKEEIEAYKRRHLKRRWYKWVNPK